MIKKVIVLVILLFAMVNGARAGQKNGVDIQVGNLQVRVEFYSPTIVRVLKTEAGSLVSPKSYSVVLKPEAVKNLNTQKTADGYEICSPYIKVRLNEKTGEICFSNVQNETLLMDIRTSLEQRKDEVNKGKWRI